jgi:hypothetical protein
MGAEFLSFPKSHARVRSRGGFLTFWLLSGGYHHATTAAGGMLRHLSAFFSSSSLISHLKSPELR